MKTVYSVKNKEEAIYYNKKVYNGSFGVNYDQIHNNLNVNHYLQKIYYKNLGEIINDLRKSYSSLNMMDVGTGTGALSLNFYKYLKSEDRVYNLDISEVMLANLKNKLSQEQILQSSFIVDDAFNFLNKSVQNFHIIGFSGALHHFYDYDKIINLAASKVLPEGYIYIGVEPKNKVIYLERVIRNIESIYYRFRMKEISFLSFLIKICYTPFHFFNKFIYKKEKNQNTINKFDYNLEEQGKTEILHGLDLKLIKTILYQNSFNIIKLQGSPGYIYNFTYRLVNFLKINDHFLLIAKKKYLNKLLIKALDGVI